MLKQFKDALLTTKEFIWARLSFTFVIAVIYILVAAFIQYFIVNILGETTFNYIFSGFVSLVVGAVLLRYLDKILFIIVRGWHMAALAYVPMIKARKLSSLSTGMTVFGKHLTSFVAVYGVSVAVNKTLSMASDKLWDLFPDVPALHKLKKFADNSLVKFIANDILRTGFDAVIYYIVRYTKPGLKDDLEVIPEALKKYLYALPQVMLTSFTLFLLSRVFTKIAGILVLVSLVLSKGVVAGLLLSVLILPVFYLLDRTVFDYLNTVVLVSCYAKQCELNSEDSRFSEIVNSILQGTPLRELFNDSDEFQIEDNTVQSSEIEEYQGEPVTDEAILVEETTIVKKGIRDILNNDTGSILLDDEDDFNESAPISDMFDDDEGEIEEVIPPKAISLADLFKPTSASAINEAMTQFNTLSGGADDDFD